MKKIIALVLVTLLLASLISCAEQSAEEVPEFNSDTGSAVDLAGYEVVLASDYKEDSATVLRYDRNTLFSDLALKRISDVETLYNCEVVPSTTSDFLGMLAVSVAGGTSLADFAFTDSWGLHNAGLVKGGMLLPISYLSDYIDYRDSAKWGSANQLESLVWNNELYGVVPISWPEYFYNACDFALVVNESTIKRLGEDDPRDLVENGLWTREKFSELVKQYTYADNNGETVYGLTLFTNHFFDIALKANGVEYAVKDGDSWKSGLHTAEALDALDWAYNFIFFENKDYIRLDGSTYNAINRFVDGGATMLLTHMGFALAPKNTSEYQSIVYNVDDFGILPFPLGNNVEYGEWVGQHEYMKTTIAFPVNSKEPEAAAIVASAIFEPLEGYETQESLIEYYTQYMFHDERDIKVILKMLENCRYTFYTDGARNIVDTIGGSNGKSTVSEILESQRESYETVLTESIIPVYESMEVLFPN